MNVLTSFLQSPVGLSGTDLTGRELTYIRQAIASGSLAGPDHESETCELMISHAVGGGEAFLVPSCSAALEMSALLLDLKPGDEVIMPSYTFVSTANAVVLRGATPVFVDVDPVTFNIDPARIEAALTPRTRAIFVVHYAGVPADIDAITAIAEPYGIAVVEDAAQAYLSGRDGKLAGNMAPLACFSFHGTKNVSAGEGGALIVNDPDLADRAAILREKGTDRTQFLEGRVSHYSWQDVGSSQVVSELTAAFLRAQLEEARDITNRRLAIWNGYRDALSDLEQAGHFRLPAPPASVQHNGHIFFVVLPDTESRKSLAAYLALQDIQAATHYVPLHSAPAGQRFGRVSGPMANTDHAAGCLLRLPLHAGMAHELVRVVDAVHGWAHERTRLQRRRAG